MKTVEYQLILADGAKLDEFIDLESEISVMQQFNGFMKLHGAVKAHPVQPSLFQDPTDLPLPISSS
jgi:hypothetical protein